jgi:hypothetical protein
VVFFVYPFQLSSVLLSVVPATYFAALLAIFLIFTAILRLDRD